MLNPEDSVIKVELIYGDEEPNVDTSFLDEIVGQSELKKQLEFFINSVSPTTPFPTILLTGSKGLGKTYTSERIAKSLGRRLVEFNCGSIKETEEFIQKVLVGQVSGNSDVCLLLDEAHELSDEIETFLLSLINPGNKNGKFVFRYNNIDIEYDMNKINVVFATTDAYMMFSPLVNRCREIYLTPYDDDEIRLILEKYAKGIKIKTDDPDLAKACRNRARNAFSVAQDIVRLCVMNDTKTFDETGWKQLKDIFNISPSGLRHHEIKMLKVLGENSPISVNNLAIVLGVNKKNIEDEISIWPRELGFIESGPRGISLSNNGIEYLSNLSN